MSLLHMIIWSALAGVCNGDGITMQGEVQASILCTPDDLTGVPLARR